MSMKNLQIDHDALAHLRELIGLSIAWVDANHVFVLKRYVLAPCFGFEIDPGRMLVVSSHELETPQYEDYGFFSVRSSHELGGVPATERSAMENISVVQVDPIFIARKIRILERRIGDRRELAYDAAIVLTDSTDRQIWLTHAPAAFAPGTVLSFGMPMDIPELKEATQRTTL